MDKGVAQIVRNKQILLFEEILNTISYDDMGVVDLLRNGVRIVWNMDRVGIWPP